MKHLKSLTRDEQLPSNQKIVSEFLSGVEIEYDDPKRHKEWFRIIALCRDDLEGRGFDTSRVDDATMEHIASKMADQFLDCCYWLALDELAEGHNISRRKRV